MGGRGDESFDVVIVGGGSSGCAAARRLVERGDLNVCLLEAGPDYGAFDDGAWPAAIIPIIPRANTNLTCFAIGFRAADVLLEAR